MSEQTQLFLARTTDSIGLILCGAIAVADELGMSQHEAEGNVTACLLTSLAGHIANCAADEAQAAVIIAQCCEALPGMVKGFREQLAAEQAEAK
jgi:hypothetical protein